LQSISSITKFDKTFLRYCSELIPYLQYKDILPPNFAYELKNVIKNESGNKNKNGIQKYIKYYTDNKDTITITQYRQYIRTTNTPYSNDTITIKNSKFNKSLFFIKRKLYTSTEEQKQIIRDSLN